MRSVSDISGAVSPCRIKSKIRIDSRDALNDFAFFYALRSCALTNMFCQLLRIFSLRRENCDEALSIEIDEEAQKGIEIAQGIPSLSCMFARARIPRYEV